MTSVYVEVIGKGQLYQEIISLSKKNSVSNVKFSDSVNYQELSLFALPAKELLR